MTPASRRVLCLLAVDQQLYRHPTGWRVTCGAGWEPAAVGPQQQRLTEENPNRSFADAQARQAAAAGLVPSHRDSSEVSEGAETVWIIRAHSLAEGLAFDGRGVAAKLIALLEGEERDDYGILRPSLFAFRRTFHLIYNAALQLREHFPAAAVSTDSEGGIRVQWIRPERQVRLIVPAAEGGQQYIYHQVGSEYAVEEDVNLQRLLFWLDWFDDGVALEEPHDR
jgi:hypothetical protein